MFPFALVNILDNALDVGRSGVDAAVGIGIGVVGVVGVRIRRGRGRRGHGRVITGIPIKEESMGRQVARGGAGGAGGGAGRGCGAWFRGRRSPRTKEQRGPTHHERSRHGAQREPEAFSLHFEDTNGVMDDRERK